MCYKKSLSKQGMSSRNFPSKKFASKAFFQRIPLGWLNSTPPRFDVFDSMPQQVAFPSAQVCIDMAEGVVYGLGPLGIATADLCQLGW